MPERRVGDEYLTDGVMQQLLTPVPSNIRIVSLSCSPMSLPREIRV
jgi:hypothetical protein